MVHSNLKIIIETFNNEKEALSLLFELKTDGFYVTIENHEDKKSVVLKNIETRKDCDEIIEDLEKYYGNRFNPIVEKE